MKKTKILDDFKNVFNYIKNKDIRSTVRQIIIKAPKYFWTVDNKELQKMVINAVNMLLLLNNKFDLSEEELDICISSIILANMCQYSATEEIWRDQDIIEDHPNAVLKYLKKKCMNEISYLNTIGVYKRIATCIHLHESKIGSEPLDKLSIIVNLSFFLCSLDLSESNKELTIEDLIYPNIF